MPDFSPRGFAAPASASADFLGWRRAFRPPESHANEIVVSPNQAAVADRSEIVEGQIKVYGNDVGAVQADTCAFIRDITHAAREDASFSGKQQPRVAIDARSADRPPLDCGCMKYLLHGRHG